MKGEPRLSDNSPTDTPLSSDVSVEPLSDTRWSRFKSSSRNTLSKCYSMGGVAFIAVIVMFASDDCEGDPDPPPTTSPPATTRPPGPPCPPRCGSNTTRPPTTRPPVTTAAPICAPPNMCYPPPTTRPPTTTAAPICSPPNMCYPPPTTRPPTTTRPSCPPPHGCPPPTTRPPTTTRPSCPPPHGCPPPTTRPPTTQAPTTTRPSLPPCWPRCQPVTTRPPTTQAPTTTQGLPPSTTTSPPTTTQQVLPPCWPNCHPPTTRPTTTRPPTTITTPATTTTIVGWDDTWAADQYEEVINTPGVDRDDLPEDASADSTVADLLEILEAIGDQHGFDESDATDLIEGFDDESTISREQMAVILCAGLTGCDPNNAIEFLEDNEITVGTESVNPGNSDCGTELGNGNCFGNDLTMSNAQMVTFISRLLTPGYTPPVDDTPSGNGDPPPTTTIQNGNNGPTCDTPGFVVIQAYVGIPGRGSDGCRPANCDFGRDTEGWCEHPEITDPPLLYVFGGGNVDEDGGPAQFRVVASHAITQAVTVLVATQDDSANGGSDYTPVSRTVTIPASFTTAYVSVLILDDTTDEPDETFGLGISSPSSNANLSPTVLANATIVDNDVGPPHQVQNLTVDCSTVGVNGEITITWQHPGTGTPPDGFELTVEYPSYDWVTNPTAYQTRLVDDTHTSYTFTSITDGWGTYLFKVVPYATGFGGGTASTRTVNCQSAPQVTANFAASTYAVDEPNTVSIIIRLNVDPQRTVVIPLTDTPQGSTVAADYSIPSSVTFNAGDTSQTVAFTAVDDADQDDESVQIGFGTLPSRVSSGVTNTTTVTINDDDTPRPPNFLS